MRKIDTVVIGASAGGINALLALVEKLPADLPAALVAVIHFPQTSQSFLSEILTRKGNLEARQAEDGLKLETGKIYVAAPGLHVLVGKEAMCLSRGPKENKSRPAIDPLFRSAAQSRGNRVIAVLMSGLLDDGTLGSMAVRKHGGTVIIQDPEEALFADMPENAIRRAGADFVLPVEKIADKIIELAGMEVPDLEFPSTVPDPVKMTLKELEDLETKGRPSAFVCPECGGTLFELEEEGISHYRCRVGHAYLAESLASSQEDAVEAAIWAAIRTIEENNDLLTRMVQRSESGGRSISAQIHRDKLQEGKERLEILRHALRK